MALRKMLVGVGGLSFTILALGYVWAPVDQGVAAREGRTAIALSAAPFVLRDGRQAVADVVRIAFEPQAVDLSEEAQEPLQDLLSRMAVGCVLSAQVVGAASEHETAPRPVADAHLLALERSDAVARLVRSSGVPAPAVASLWTVDSGREVPHSVLWVFSSKSKSECADRTTSLEMAAVPVESTAGVGTARAMIVSPAMSRPQRDRSVHAGQAAAELSSATPASVGRLALTFSNNSSYLSDQEIARLRRFASNLGSSCTVTLKATVAGGADAPYAAWLAERRLARVADHLSEQATVANRVLVQNDASRQVVVEISDKSDCAGKHETNVGSDIAVLN